MTKTSVLMTASNADRKHGLASAMVLLAAMTLAGCATTTETTDVIRLDRAQGSQENIASLTAVIQSNPRDPEGYNINPQFFQAYANRALVYRNMGKPVEAAADYNAALKINPNYDVAYIGRGNIYRQAGRIDEAFGDF
ncbi:hypothetical protein A4X03_0g9560, partial [Tilletia caries]